MEKEFILQEPFFNADEREDLVKDLASLRLPKATKIKFNKLLKRIDEAENYIQQIEAGLQFDVIKLNTWVRDAEEYNRLKPVIVTALNNASELIKMDQIIENILKQSK